VYVVHCGYGALEGRSGLEPWMGGPPDYFLVLPKRSIPKPDQLRKRYYTTRVVRHWYFV